MLTQQQRDTFRLALASLNCYTVEKVEDLDIDEMLTDEEVVETRDTVDNFFTSNGRKLNRKGERPEVPYEQNQTLLGAVFQWDNIQSRKGARRGTLYVMDFGDARATLFTGEV